MEIRLSIDQETINLYFHISWPPFHFFTPVSTCKTKGLDCLLGQTLQGTYHLSNKVPSATHLTFESNDHQIIFIKDLKVWEK